MSNTFEFADKFGFESFFEDEVVFNDEKYLWTASVDFNNLAKKLNPSNFIYNPDKNLKSAITKLSINKTITDYLLGKNKENPNSNWFISKTSRIPYKDDEQEFFYDAFLSPETGKTVRKERAEFNFNISLENNLFKYRVLFPFNSFNYDDPINKKYAIIVESDNYDELEVLLKDIGVTFNSIAKNRILNEFKKEFIKAGDDRNKLDKIYQFSPKFVIKSRGKRTIIKDLKNILRGFVDEEYTNEEVAVLNMLSALNSKLNDTNSSKDANTEFLRILITEKIGNSSISIFQKLYDKLDDRGGEGNFTKFILMMYVFWRESDYIYQDQYEGNTDVGPTSLPYQNKQILGFYENGFDFSFNINRKEPHVFVKRGHDDIVGMYHLFQPIQLPEVDQKTKSLILYDTYVPAFYLKAFDDKAAWDNFEKGVWTGIEFATTLVGVGNVLKFRHLLKFKRAGQAIELKLALGTVEVASGALGTILNFVNECNPGAEKSNGGKKTFCQHLRDFLILLDIATLSIDGIDELLRIQARRTRNSGYQILKESNNIDTENQINDIIRGLENITELGANLSKGGDITKSFFYNAKILLKEETPLGNVLGQTKHNTCAANSLRMVLDDIGYIRSEQYLEVALETTKDGANILDIPKAIAKDYIENLNFIVRGGIKDKNVKFSTLIKQFKNPDGRKVIVSVRTEEFGAHAIVIDKIKDGRVFVRDPLPLQQGSSYSVEIDDFKRVFNNKFVIIKE